jgi:U3 small nucleolar RNA-associated protein 15
MSSSLLSLRSRTTSAIKSNALLPSKRAHVPAFRDYQSILPQDEPEYTFREKKKKSLRDYDFAILGFRFADALDLVMQKVFLRTKWLIQNDDILISTILMELKHRASLPQALQNRTPETLLPILQWMDKNISDPRYAPVIMDVTHQILGIIFTCHADDRYLWS